MSDVSIGSVSLGLGLDKVDFLGQMQDLTSSAASILSSGLKQALRIDAKPFDASKLFSGLDGIKTDIKDLGKQVEAAIQIGGKAGATAIAAEVAAVKVPKIKVELSKEALTAQLDNMVAQLDNLNAQIAERQSKLSLSQVSVQTKPQAINYTNPQDYVSAMDHYSASAGQTSMSNDKLLAAEAEIIKMQGQSDLLVTKINAVESALNSLGSTGSTSVSAVTKSTQKAVSQVTSGAENVKRELKSMGDSGAKSTRKISSGLSDTGRSAKNIVSQIGSSTGVDKRLANIDNRVAKLTRSVSALGRRFLVLFSGKLISAAFSGVSDSLTGATKKSDDLKESLDTLTTAGRNVANGIIAAVSPLINAVAPTLGTIADKIRVFSNRVAMFFAALTGQKTVLQATAAYEEYGEAVTSAAEAQKSLAGFDTLNILSSPKTSSSSSSSSSSDTDAFETVAVSGGVADSANKFKKLLSPIGEAFSDLWDEIKPLKDEAVDFWDNYLSKLAKWTLGEGIPDFIDTLTAFLGFMNDHPGAAIAIVGTATGFWAVYKALSAIAGIKSILQILGLVKSGGTITVAQTLTGGTLSVSTLLVAGAIVAATVSYITDEDGAEQFASRVAEAWENMTHGNGTFTDSLVSNPLTGIGLGAFDFFDYIGAQVAGALDWREGKTTDWYQEQRIARNQRWTENVDNVMSVSNISDNLAESSPLQLNNDALQKIPEGRDLVESPYSFVVTDNSGNAWKEINDNINYTRQNWEGTMSGMPSDIEDMLKKSGKLVEDGAKGWEGSMSGMPSALQDALSKSGKIVKTSVANTKTQYDGLTSSVTSSLTTIAQNAKDKVSSVVTSWQGMPSSIQAIMENTNSVIATKTAEGAAAASNSARIGKEGSANEYSSLKDRISAIFQGITDSITGQSEVGKNNLLTATSVGTSGTKEGYRNLVNKLNEYMAAMANNSATATKRTFQTLGGMPTSVQRYLGISWDGFKESAAISFPAFAQGAYLGANQPTLALVGDNKHEGEFVAPESKLIEAVTKGVNIALKSLGSPQPAATAAGDITIIIGDRQITDYVTERTNRNNRLKNK